MNNIFKNIKQTFKNKYAIFPNNFTYFPQLLDNNYQVKQF